VSAETSWMKRQPVMSAMSASQQFLFLARPSARCRLVTMIRGLQGSPGCGRGPAAERGTRGAWSRPHTCHRRSPARALRVGCRGRRGAARTCQGSRELGRERNESGDTDLKQKNVVDEGGEDVEHEEDVALRERAASPVGNRLDVIVHAFDEWQVGRVGRRLVLRAEDLKEPARGCVPARGGFKGL
jgi:hypothetical protein